MEPKKTPLFQFTLFDFLQFVGCTVSGTVAIIWQISSLCGRTIPIEFILETSLGVMALSSIAAFSAICYSNSRNWRMGWKRVSLNVLAISLPVILLFLLVPRSRIHSLRGNAQSARMALGSIWEAELKYRVEDFDGDGYREFADNLKKLSDYKLIDSKIADADSSLPNPKPYNGYLFKIITKQGEHASGGRKSYYQVDSQNTKSLLRGGFGVLAIPCKLGWTGDYGVIVNQDFKILGNSWTQLEQDEFVARDEYDQGQIGAKCQGIRIRTWCLVPHENPL